MANEVKKKARVVDKWKLKSWYAIKAPEIFDGREMGQLVSTEEEQLKDRVVKTGLGELTGSFSGGAAFTTVFFRVTGVTGKTLSTKFIGHELSPSYIKTLLRRRRSIIYCFDDATASDGQVLRIKSVAVTAFKVSEAARKDLRRAVSESVKACAKELNINMLAQEVLFGKFAARVFTKVKHITPLRRLEIRKSELKEIFE